MNRSKTIVEKVISVISRLNSVFLFNAVIVFLNRNGIKHTTIKEH
jgi:hypothetical protein